MASTHTVGLFLYIYVCLDEQEVMSLWTLMVQKCDLSCIILCFKVVIYIIILIPEIKYSFLKALCTDATILVTDSRHLYYCIF